MTFTTLTFLLFLPVVFGLYWRGERATYRNIVLVGASYVFYGWWDYRFCALMLAASLWDFAAGLALERVGSPAGRRLVLGLSIGASLSLLGFFKYWTFFAESTQALAGALGWRLSPVTLHVVLPIGISFYTFQTMSYVIDVYRRRMRATPDLLAYLAYVSFFPQLVAGPIERGPHLLPQFLAARRFDSGLAAEGCRYILWGFFKKLAIADALAPLVDGAYADVGRLTGPALALATVAFAFQIYCDFSAYSDIALGTARLFGIELMRNFAYPYFSGSPAEFWRRWHISLSSWFADYVYVPLGGSRVPAARHVLNVLATFVLSGLWHGPSWHFVVWGLFHGLLVVPSALWSRGARVRATDTPGGEAGVPRPATVGRMVGTFGLVCVGWVLFRAQTVGDAVAILGKIALDACRPAAYAGLPGMSPTLAAVAGLVAVEWAGRRHPLPLRVDGLAPRARLLVYTAMLWLTLWLTPPRTGPFIYFQF